MLHRANTTTIEKIGNARKRKRKEETETEQAKSQKNGNGEIFSTQESALFYQGARIADITSTSNVVDMVSIASSNGGSAEQIEKIFNKKELKEIICGTKKSARRRWIKYSQLGFDRQKVKALFLNEVKCQKILKKPALRAKSEKEFIEIVSEVIDKYSYKPSKQSYNKFSSNEHLNFGQTDLSSLFQINVVHTVHRPITQYLYDKKREDRTGSSLKEKYTNSISSLLNMFKDAFNKRNAAIITCKKIQKIFTTYKPALLFEIILKFLNQRWEEKFSTSLDSEFKDVLTEVKELLNKLTNNDSATSSLRINAELVESNEGNFFQINDGSNPGEVECLFPEQDLALFQEGASIFSLDEEVVQNEEAKRVELDGVTRPSGELAAVDQTDGDSGEDLDQILAR